ncbi:MAG: hypothetical protein ACOYVK_13670 [Bacillota bacterium]
MDQMPVYILLLGAIPEAILMVWAGLLLVGVRPPVRKVLLTGVLLGLSSYFVRQYVDFGVHALVNLMFFVIFIRIIFDVKTLTSILASLLAFVVVIMIEGPMVIFFEDSAIYLMSRDLTRLAFFLPHELTLAGIIYICYKKNISLVQELGSLGKFMR